MSKTSPKRKKRKKNLIYTADAIVRNALIMYEAVARRRSFWKELFRSVKGPTRNANDEIKKKDPKKNSLANLTGIMMDMLARKKKIQASKKQPPNMVSRCR